MPPASASKTPEPEDIFSGARLGKGGPVYPNSPEATASIAESPGRGLGRKLVRLLFLALGAAVIVTAGYFGYQYFLAAKAPSTPPPTENTNLPINLPPNANFPANPPITNTNENANVNINTNTQAPLINENGNTPSVTGENFLPPQDDPNSTLDTDRDGLTDYQETHVYGTDLLQPDTDRDGLTDRDEVITWNTDPRNPDSDGDGYSDGSEIENGYNPSGPGKLLPPPVQ